MTDKLESGAIKLFVMRLTGKALAFILFVILARVMTINSYGELIYLFSWIAIITVIAPLGLDVLVLRYANSFIADNKPEYAKGLYLFSQNISVVSTTTLATLFITVLYFTGKLEKLSIEAIIGIYFIFLFTGYMAIRRTFLLSLKKAVPAELPEAIIRPALVISLLTGILYFSPKNISTNQVIIIIATSWVLIFYGGKLWFNHIVKSLLTKKIKYKKKNWIQAGLPIMVVTLGFTTMAEIDVIILASMGTIEDSAIYSVATRYMQMFSLPLGVIQSISASSLALHHHRKDTTKYSILAAKISKFSFLVAIPIFIVIFLFSDMLLSLFGEDYKKGALVLIVLASVATVNAWFGATGYSLTMTGKQNFLAKLIFLALIINVCLDVILIPAIGIEGAAIATLVSILSWNIIAIIYIKKELGYSIVWVPFINNSN